MISVSTVVLILLALVPSQLLPQSLLLKVAAPSTTVKTTSLLPSYQPLPVPVKTHELAPPAVSATSWYALDLDTGQPLGALHADTQRPIASITKMATALVILNDHQLEEVITIPTLPAYLPEDEIIGLKPGEHLTIKDLLAALLVHSANDAADALAIADSGSREAFATKMNQLMVTWQIKNAHFSNPSGLQEAGNGASARALASIGSLLLHNATARRQMTVQETTISTREGRQLRLVATNKLLPSGTFSGIKTGYTVAAGQCFVGLANVQGHQVITVVLGSQDRFGDSQRLADWVNHSYQWQPSP